MVRRYAAGTAAGAALAVSLTGCLGASGNAKTNAADVSADQAIALVAKKTGSVSSYKVDMTATGTGKAAGSAHAVVQVRLHPSVAAIGTLDQAHFGGTTLPGGERAILLGDNVYVKVPSQATQYTNGKPWVKFNLAKAAKRTDLNQIMAKADPAEQAKMFIGAQGIHKVGTQTINGVRTTQYEGSLTPQEAAARLKGHARQSFQDFYQRAGAQKVVFDMWVGDDNLPRKLVTKATATQGTATATMVYSAFNQSVTVTAPPADQVVSADQIRHNWNTPSNTPG